MHFFSRHLLKQTSKNSLLCSCPLRVGERDRESWINCVNAAIYKVSVKRYYFNEAWYELFSTLWLDRHWQWRGNTNIKNDLSNHRHKKSATTLFHVTLFTQEGSTKKINKNDLKNHEKYCFNVIHWLSGRIIPWLLLCSLPNFFCRFQKDYVSNISLQLFYHF